MALTLPICAVTGLIAGDADACGDCDPCGAAHAVPEVVKRLLAEKEMWRRKYGEAAAAADAQNMICGACGQPWTGESCGQKDNGWPFPVCNPIPAALCTQEGAGPK